MDHNQEVVETQAAQPVPAASGTNALPGARQVFKEAWNVFKSRFWKLQAFSWLPAGVMLAIGLVIGIVLAILLPVLGYSYDTQSVTALIEKPVMMFLTVVIGFVLIIAFVLFSTWAQIALVYATGRPETGIKEAFVAVRPKIFTFIWAGFLYAFIMMGGMLLLVVPGIYLAIVLSLYLYVVTFENEKGLNALIKSREYSRGRFWKLLRYGLYPLIFIIPIWLISIALSTAIGESALTFFPDVIGRILSTVFGPLFIAYGYGIYAHMKEGRALTEFAPTQKTRWKYAGLGILGLLLIPVMMTAVTLASLNAAREKGMEASQTVGQSQASEYVELTLPENWEYVESSSPQLGARRTDDAVAVFIQASPVVTEGEGESDSIEDVATLEEFETSIRGALADDEQVTVSVSEIDGHSAYKAEYLDYDQDSGGLLRINEYLLVTDSMFVSIILVGLNDDETLSAEFERILPGIDIK